MTRARLEWLTPLLLTLVAAALRFTGLWHPQDLVFDETYYVKDAWTLLHLGYEATWPDDANELFTSGDTDVYSTDPAYVVHPPLGKWLIALGMLLFGADSGWGWRFSAALAGTLLVPLVYAIARRLSGSVAVGAIAGGLLAVDGLAIALSRVSLLDGFLAFFVTLAFWFVLLDRDRTEARILSSESRLGPVIWNRPWILAAGAALGAATAVKWSGLYVLAGLGVYLVVTDALVRRRAGVKEWYASAVVRQGPVSFLQLVPVAAVVYVLSWLGWLATSGGYDRGSDPNPLVALWNYHSSMYGFHVGLTSGHPYASPAWQWPLLLRPTAMWLARPETGEEWCGWSDDCIGVIGSHPNPITWYGAWAAVLLVVVLLIRRRAGRLAPGIALALTGLAVTYVPWLLYPSRTIFQFYTVAMLPFLVILLALAIGWLARPRDPVTLADPSPAEHAYAVRQARTETRAWRTVLAVFLVIALLAAAFFLPLSTGFLEPYGLWRLHNWLPGWV
ncbi:dolichyl-phosphate-mannose--protein mannosyltransferase [Microbacterium marinilacus]|uniref:Polyprenol-phosphate-mannose--protein mannosyltransferase n=1 Tax=Microbacterium marinilacus TaxID=415209 RepID=A0ABP7B961_9MICO|nr:phospholipid carrier-dependent glycosyltransferase [Microbacterium marinilacus]MBY0687327.1 phospholipid carrier-dependent glycosyltransferase [Microbacterium marinilacus]